MLSSKKRGRDLVFRSTAKLPFEKQIPGVNDLTIRRSLASQGASQGLFTPAKKRVKPAEMKGYNAVSTASGYSSDEGSPRPKQTLQARPAGRQISDEERKALWAARALVDQNNEARVRENEARVREEVRLKELRERATLETALRESAEEGCDSFCCKHRLSDHTCMSPDYYYGTYDEGSSTYCCGCQDENCVLFEPYLRRQRVKDAAEGNKNAKQARDKGIRVEGFCCKHNSVGECSYQYNPFDNDGDGAPDCCGCNTSMGHCDRLLKLWAVVPPVVPHVDVKSFNYAPATKTLNVVFRAGTKNVMLGVKGLKGVVGVLVTSVNSGSALNSLQPPVAVYSVLRAINGRALGEGGKDYQARIEHLTRNELEFTLEFVLAAADSEDEVEVLGTETIDTRFAKAASAGAVIDVDVDVDVEPAGAVNVKVETAREVAAREVAAREAAAREVAEPFVQLCPIKATCCRELRHKGPCGYSEKSILAFFGAGWRASRKGNAWWIHAPDGEKLRGVPRAEEYHKLKRGH